MSPARRPGAGSAITGTVWKAGGGNAGPPPPAGDTRERSGRIAARIEEDLGLPALNRSSTREEREIVLFLMRQSSFSRDAHAASLKKKDAKSSLVSALGLAMSRHGIPTARRGVFRDILLSYINEEPGDSVAPAPPGYILTVRTLPVEMLNSVDPQLIKAVVCESGSAASHSALYLKTLGIPAFFGMKGFYDSVQQGQLVSLDSDEMKVYSDSSSWDLEEAGPLFGRGVPRTLDGAEIHVRASVNDLSEVEVAWALCAEGIGLVRTEFLFLGARSEPSPFYQSLVYSELAKSRAGRDAVVRLFDFGPDKPLGWLDENNRSEVYARQIGSLLESYKGKPFGLLIPKAPSPATVREVRRMVRERQGSGAQAVKVGAMIETLEGARDAEAIISEADFVSIGSNDLSAQAAGQVRETQDQLTYMNPAFLRIVANLLSLAAKAGKPAAICGEVLRDREMCALMTGLGARSFSVAARSVPEVSGFVTGVDLAAASVRAKSACTLPGAMEVSELLYAYPQAEGQS